MGYDPYAEYPYLARFPRIDEYRNKLKITIFGSYRTSKAKKRLEKARDYLQNLGYKQSKLVEDWVFPKNNNELEPEEYYDLKSSYWIKKSDVLFFIFHLNSDQSGVSSEFTELADNNIDRLWRTVVFIEVKKLGVKDPVSTRISSRIKRHQLKRVQFPRNNDRYLHKKLEGSLPNYTSRLLKELINR
ncbi:MAG: hypothetical protein GWN01_01850 [Nitrosopumilaceae archaeon]|nr:hypothetical protein [Nitrosopumilaceae archaeon]NIT99716.1 hypothetical protein [Nitrosopumilaceae archaeon]NIU88577.1 hypothetical protein [Nitrosopumilaceae archaeon]NIV64851.1 hypothetical protein [Nitrosopumilaceae archaeon]NIX60319.1 hypothetical protein [Nitrosopumilaceae archaeon]